MTNNFGMNNKNYFCDITNMPKLKSYYGSIIHIL